MTRWQRLRRSLRKRLGDSAGATLVEAAIMTPLLLLLTFAIVDMGAMFYAYLALENGVSQAVRYGVTGNVMPGFSRADSIKSAMRTATPTLTIPDGAFSFSYIPDGGSGWIGGVGGPDAIQRVDVNYTWTFMTPLMRPFFAGGRLNIHVSATMKNEGRFE